MRENVRPELLDVFDRYTETMFEVADEDVCQNGKLKTEGYFRGEF